MHISPYIYKFIFIVLIELSLISALTFFIYLIIKSLKKTKKNPETDWLEYKITNFYLNIFYISLYFILFIFILSFLRIKRFNIHLDLKLLVQKFQYNFFDLTPINRINSIFVYLIVVLLILLCLLLLIKLNRFFIKEIKKRHLYMSYTKLPDGSTEDSPYLTYFTNFNSTLGYRYSYGYVAIFWPIRGNIKSYFYYKFKPQKIGRFITKLINPIFTLLPTFILFLLFFYDCYYNSFVISKVFNYMLIYVPYMYYYNIAMFQAYSVPQFDELFYQMYYSTKERLFINAPDELTKVLEKYIFDDLYKEDSGLPFIKDKTSYSATEIVMYFYEYCLYIREKDTNKYVSRNGTYFYEEEENI